MCAGASVKLDMTVLAIVPQVRTMWSTPMMIVLPKTIFQQ